MKLSIVIICWNDWKVIENCLHSIFESTRKVQYEVIVSDNGGDVFYRANNSLANGTYVYEGQTILPEDEVQRDRMGYQLGKHWIVSHPLQFLWLAERKLTFLLGDDGVGGIQHRCRSEAPYGSGRRSVYGKIAYRGVP